MKKPIVFLDIDGVLASNAFDAERASLQERGECALVVPPDLLDAHAGPSQERRYWIIALFHAIDERAVARLARICDATDAEIVVSSSWRESVDLGAFAAVLRAKGCSAPVIGRTLALEDRYATNNWDALDRGEEIALWLRENSRGASPFVVLDDQTDIAPVEDRWVRTTLAYGLQDAHIDRAITLLREAPRAKGPPPLLPGEAR